MTLYSIDGTCNFVLLFFLVLRNLSSDYKFERVAGDDSVVQHYVVQHYRISFHHTVLLKPE